ncbi:MAG: winged helix-turn-helix domain-containing protein [Kistimonas sp.]|nr:winged helix-turn-helix domain-containing protein [Kistimonas sp.]
MNSTPLKIGDYLYHPDRSCLLINGVVIRISENEHKLLELLLERRQQLVTKEEILNTLWGQKHVVVDNGSVNTAISKLRKCFGDSTTESRFIRTVRGEGYVLIADVEEVDATQVETGLPPAKGSSAFGSAVRPDPFSLPLRIALSVAFILLLACVLFSINTAMIKCNINDDQIIFLLGNGRADEQRLLEGERSTEFDHYAADQAITCVLKKEIMVCSP